MDKAAVDRLIGQTLEGRLRIVRQLGQGGTSHVLLAHHEELDVPVALKILTERSDNLHAHAVQEGRLLFRINHPNVVRVHDFFRGRELDALVLEYVEGQTLARLSPMAWRRACTLLLQCCAAVEAVHAVGFLHRDVTPGNFLVARGLGDDDEVIKLIDLGTAKHIQGQEPLAELLEQTTAIPPCTPVYAAPEFARGERRGSFAADTYGLAVTLFACVVGRPPWVSKDIELLMQQIALEPPFIPEDVLLPAPLRELLLRALDKDPARRFATPRELATAIGEILRPTPAAVTKVEPVASVAAATNLAPSRPPRGSRTVRMLSAAGGAAAMFGLLAAATMTLERTEVDALELDPADEDEPAEIPERVQFAVSPRSAPTTPAAPAAAPSSTARTTNTTMARTTARTTAAPRPTDPAAQLRRLIPRLRKCPQAPAGSVLFELDGGRLRRLDLMDLDPQDQWHHCAATTVAAIAGTAKVDLRL